MTQQKGKYDRFNFNCASAVDFGVIENNDFYGVNRESEPTEAATVTSVPRGLAISVR